MLIVFLSFIVPLMVLAAFLYGAAKIVGVKTPYSTLFMIALIGSICSAVPIGGFLLGLLVVLILLVLWGKMSFGAAIMTVIMAYILAFLIVLGLAVLLGISFLGLNSVVTTPAMLLIQ